MQTPTTQRGARSVHRALADDTRAAIYEALRRGGGTCTVQELAGRFGLHPNTVRSHLRILVESGLASATTEERGGRGRPPIAFRAAGEAPPAPGSYRLLAEILAGLVNPGDPRDAAKLERVGRAWGRYLVDSPSPGTAVATPEALRRLVDLLDRSGFEPELEEEADMTRICMRPCPFLDLAIKHPNVVCQIHLGLMRGALEELGTSMTAEEIEPFADGDRCVARLARAS